MQGRFESHFDYLGLTVRISRKVNHTTTCFALSQVIFFVASYAGDIEALHIINASSTVAVNDIVDGTGIVLFEDIDVDDIRSDEYFLRYANNLVLSVAVEDNNIVDIRTIAQELILLESGTYEAFFAIDIEFLVGLNYGFHIDVCEVAHLGLTRIFISVFSLEVLEPANGIIG